MQVGDKLLCKKDFIHELEVYFHVDKLYTITKVVKHKNNDMWIYFNDEIIGTFYFLVSLIRDDSLYAYFYTKKELRKFKLEKIKK
jgi:ubiquitin C-terminal hydrolase